LPDATVARLPIYLRALAMLSESGRRTVSSEELATASGVTSAKVRKDLSQLGSYGTRGVGYDCDQLTDEISRVLGLGEHRCVVLAGVGNLGHALAGYAGFATKGFRIVALVDADPRRVGESLGGLQVQPVSVLEQVIREHGASIGVIATPASAAQDVCDRMVSAGVTSILNFAPVVLSVPEGVDVRKVDLSIELQILSFHEQRKARAALNRPTGSGLGQLSVGARTAARGVSEPVAAPLEAVGR
jgi:redox-sensing transcriptional repressor